MARRERQFAQLRDPIQHSVKPSAVQSPAMGLSKNLASSSISVASGNSRASRNRQFRQEALNSRVKTTEAVEYRPQPVVTHAEPLRPSTKAEGRNKKPQTNHAEESPSKKLKDVCVNCVNKLISNKQKLKELQRKEQERKQEKQRLEAERDIILQQQAQHIRRVREEQQQMDRLLAEKKAAKDKERLRQLEGQVDLKESLRRAEAEESKITRNEQERRQEFYQSLSHQVEEERQRRKKQEIERKTGAFPIIDDQDYQQELMKRTNQYRQELLKQMEDKQEREKRVRQQEVQLQKKFVEALNMPEYVVHSMMQEPHIRVSEHYEDLRKQVEQRQELKLKKQEDSRRRDQQEKQRQQQEQQQQNEQFLKQRMQQMSNYISELSQQAAEKREREMKERRERLEPGYVVEPELCRPEFANCTECDLKFPRNYLSNVEI